MSTQAQKQQSDQEKQKEPPEDKPKENQEPEEKEQEKKQEKEEQQGEEEPQGTQDKQKKQEQPSGPVLSGPSDKAEKKSPKEPEKLDKGKSQAKAKKQPHGERVMSDKTGSVYVFNIAGEAMSAFAPNGLTAGAIDNWSTGGDNPYTPAQLAVRRVETSNEAPGNFIDGSNKVLFKLAEVYNFEIEIYGVPIEQDLILYVSRNSWVLYFKEGAAIKEGQVRPGPAYGFTV